jgi:D-tagatose-1,6-bisphosphate aldolase subunit GatZ/KbaZ
MALRSGGDAGEWLLETIDRNRQQGPNGIYSVCSAHPRVLEAAVRHARDNGSMLCIESTSNQVNQFGGYTGQSPAQFASFVAGLASEAGFGRERVLLGGDHLGPYPWRAQPSRQALQNGCELVQACVLAGYGKIHLDASMACADDLSPALGDELVAQRAAELCAAAEDAWGRLPSGSPPPVYVIGTEVPVPGGETASSARPQPTTVEHMQKRWTHHTRHLWPAGYRRLGTESLAWLCRPEPSLATQSCTTMRRRTRECSRRTSRRIVSYSNAVPQRRHTW